jgi:PAS domain S-box-containing protein
MERFESFSCSESESTMANESPTCDEVGSDERLATENLASPVVGGGLILVVEDSAVQARMMLDALSEQGYDVAGAASIKQASCWLASNDPLLIVLDYRLPDGEGGVLVKALQAAERRIPFIIMTASGSESIAVDMMKHGALDYLVKDSSLVKNLVETVRRATERLNAERALAETRRSLRQAELRMQRMIDASPDAFVSMNADGAIVHWNPAAEKAFGYGLSEMFGREALILFPPRLRADVDRLSAERRAPAETEPAPHRFETIGLRKDGLEFPVEISIFTLDLEGTKYVNLFLQDISERKRMESQLVRSEKMASLGVLAAGMAHEINNPLCFVTSNLESTFEYLKEFSSLIDGYESLATAVQAGDAVSVARRLKEVEELRRACDLDFIRGDIGTLREESSTGLRRIVNIIKNLQSFARPADQEETNVDLNECLESTLGMLAAELKLKAEIIKELRPLPPLRCRPGQLNQAFLGILRNAGQSMVTSGRITVGTESSAGAVIVRIADTGCGIQPENMSRLFTPFFSTRGEGNGAGLGLATAYGIVQDHGGRIEVESELGKGTVVTVRIPLTIRQTLGK